MTDLIYRLMGEEDAAEVSALVLSGFDTYIASEYTPGGIAEFRKYAETAALVDRAKHDHFVVIVRREGILAGMIEMRQNNHVSLLFVVEAFQRQGLSRTLLDHAMAEVRDRGGELERVTVNSSRYGVPAYKALGFRQTGPERSVNGILFTPMAMRLDTRQEAGSQTSAISGSESGQLP